MINKHKSNKMKENSNTVRHLNNGTDHRHSKSCCDQSSPARRTMKYRIAIKVFVNVRVIYIYTLALAYIFISVGQVYDLQCYPINHAYFNLNHQIEFTVNTLGFFGFVVIICITKMPNEGTHFKNTGNDLKEKYTFKFVFNYLDILEKTSKCCIAFRCTHINISIES